MSEEVEVLRIPNGNYPTVRTPDSYDDFRGTNTPLVIDNGSTTLRFGFATSTSPKSAPNIVSKFKERKTNKPLLLFGDAVDVESGARTQSRTPWEGDVLLNFDALVSSILCKMDRETNEWLFVGTYGKYWRRGCSLHRLEDKLATLPDWLIYVLFCVSSSL